MVWDFLKEALPWVIIGISVIIVVTQPLRKNSGKNAAQTDDGEAPKEKGEKSGEGNYMTLGMCIGMCFGSAFGQLMYNNTAIGLSIGMCLGIAIGSSIQKK